MKVLNKLLSLLLCLILLAGLCAPAAMAAEERTVIRIYTANDLIKLSEKCALDSWSRDKTVLLERDIDLSLTQFHPIPTFGGTFNGQNHTISGLNLRTNGEVQGLFRYVQQSGVIKNLTVDGALIPSENKTFLGGIAGINYGTITHCMFRGTVRGTRSVGGIAGVNQTSGQIVNCSFAGSITGEHYVGGITGQNLGSVVQCRNSGSVNTTEVNVAFVPENLNLEDLTSSENMPACTDIGGIAGFSSGTIQSCHNAGSVGYPHVGYNIGGIAGRHNGYLGSCTNSGLIRGRKDVGGIAGQMEPQLMLKYDQTALDLIWGELDTLGALIDGFLGNTSGTVDALTGSIQGVSDSAAEVKDTVADLSSAMTDWVDGNISQINDASARISWVVERMVPVADTVEAAMDQMEQAFDLLSAGLDEASLAAEYGADAAQAMIPAMEELQGAIDFAGSAVSRLISAMDDITKALGDPETAGRAMADMSDAFRGFTAAFGEISDALGEIYDAMARVDEWIQTDPAWIDLRESVRQLRHAFSDVFEALGGIAEILETIVNAPDFNAGLDLLSASVRQLLDSFAALSSAADNFFTAYDQYRSGNTSEAIYALDMAFADLGEAEGTFNLAVDTLTAAFDLIENSDSIQAHLPELEARCADLADALGTFGDTMAHIDDILDSLAQSGIFDREIAMIRSALDTLRAQLDIAADAVTTFSSALTALIENIEPDGLKAAWNNIKLTLAALEIASNKLTLAVDHLNSALASLSDAAGALADGLDYFSDAAAVMADAFASIEQAVSDAGGILEELAAMPAIRFEELGETVTDKGNALNTASERFFDSFSALNSILNSQGDLLTDDLRAINAQVGAIIDLLHQYQQEQISKNDEDLLEDVSAQSADDSMSNGKISGCENTGTVAGDLNVAGIVGSVAIEYDFDPEDDLSISGQRNIDAAFLTRGVIRSCTNRGAITAKKNAVGGIAGLIDMGYVSGCRSYGTVASTAGKYVGGIAGQSYGTIADSWAMCALSGGGYVGGIAGLGTVIENCRTLIDAQAGIPFTGAVAGQMAEGGTLTGNLFVHHVLAGVDGISYDGGAQPVPYEEFAALEGLPSEFTEFSLTFTAEGKTVAVIPFRYGDSLAQLPAIPEKRANSARWPEMDYSFLFFSRTLEAQYTPYDTALSDGQSLPTYLVDGSFSPEAVISVTESQVTWGDDLIPAYTVTVTDPQSKQISYTLHWRLPEEGDYDLWVLYGSEWVKEDYTPDGSYLLLTCSGEQITFCLTQQRSLPVWVFVLIGAAAVLIVVVIVVTAKNGTRKKNLTAAET